MDDYREYLYGLGLCERTIGEYERELRRCTEWMARQGHDLATVPPSVVAAYCETRIRSWATRKMIRSALRHWWTMSGRPAPPVGAIRVPPKPRGRCRALDEDDVVILAKAARSRGDDPGLAVALMLYAGLRRNEVATLTWECFDPTLDWVRIHGKLDVEASVPVHPRLRALLLAKGRTTGYLFPGRFPDRPSTSARIWYWVRAVAEEAGVPDVAPHRLRHSCIASALDNTSDIKAVQSLARHANLATTSTYTRTTDARVVAVVEALGY